MRSLCAPMLGLMLFATPAAGANLTRLEALRLFDRAADRLALSAEQRSEIFFLLAAHAAEIKARLEQEAAADRALQEAVARPAFDERLILDRACRKADADREAALLAGRLFARIWDKLDDRQRSLVRAFLEASPPPADLYISGARRFAGGKDIYLTIQK
jgi:hypothetical protein